jgi:hypothetical protein
MVLNRGSEQLGVPGPYNISAAPVYGYSASFDATELVLFGYFNTYGGSSKIVAGNATISDSITFTSWLANGLLYYRVIAQPL